MHPILTRCPTCGGRNLRLLRSALKTKVEGRVATVPAVERQQCSDCGEVVFDCAAMERLESYRRKRSPLAHTRR
ncbi:MAG: YgiT-type zinc finger protein [Planctomycetes bacterium]|nr:YgiT-type zinc finger protein [Planctomycetota bacterium]